MPGKFGRHKQTDEPIDPTEGVPESPALPEANIVSEFPEDALDPEEATKHTGRAVVVKEDGTVGDIYLYRHPKGGYVYGDKNGPDKDAWVGVDADTIRETGKPYGDKGWRPVR